MIRPPLSDAPKLRPKYECGNLDNFGKFVSPKFKSNEKIVPCFDDFGVYASFFSLR